ncbi:hypothetical protein LIER_01708 [Lithospermum erythrorhizon]|uniref:Uncharacterized protein n=1 Tax=Lithospermum erythrorhizon TaxID=34254 RepID=A0AAV3NRG2_LITER
MTMSGGEGRKIDIDMVHNCIEQCLKLYMSKKEAADTLSIQKHIEPQITELVWQRLEEQNQEFFKAYYLKLMVKEQIMEFNRLLADQVDLMRRTGLVGVPSMPTPNGSNVSTSMLSLKMCPECGDLICRQVHRAGENPGCALGSNDMHTPIMTNLPNAFTNHGPAINSCMRSTLGMPVHNRGVDVPSNMFLSQSTSMGIRQTLNPGVIKREADYATSSFNYAAPSNFVGSHSAMADASMSSFSSVDSSLQPLNGSILDTDASSFGFLGQLQNFSLQNLTSNISTNPDILDGYPEAQFLSSNNILDPQGNISRFG